MYRRALNKDASNGDAYYRLGLASLKLQGMADAARAFRRAVDLQPNNADAATKLADIYWLAYVSNPAAGKSLVPEIQELTDTLRKRDPKSFDGLRLAGYLALAKPDVPEALKDFELANSVKPYDPQLCFVLANTLLSVNRMPEAEKLAKDVIQKNKTFAAMYDLLLTVYMRTNRIADAEQILKQKVQNNPSYELYRLELATFYYGTQRRPEMEKTLQDIISDPKSFPFARLAVGKFFGRMGDLDRARREYDAGMAATPKEKTAYQRAIIELLAAQGKYTEATALVNDVLKADPKDSIALELRSALAIQSGDPVQISTAVNDLQTLVSKNTGNPVLRLQLGRALMAKGLPDQARTNLEEALRLRPNLLPAKLLLAQIFVKKGDYSRALTVTDEILSADARNMNARLIRTSALLGIGDKTRAKQELEAISKAVSNSVDAKYQLGFINFNEGNYKESAEIFRQLRDLNPGDSRGMVGMVETEVAQKNFKGAVDLVENELKKDPKRNDMRLMLASVLARAGQYDDSIAQFQMLIQSNPKSADLETKLAETYRLKGDFNSAVEHFRKASALSPNDIQPLVRVGMLLDGIGRRQEAKPVYEQIIRLEPDNAIALNNLAYIKAEEGTDLDQAMTYAQRAKQRVPQDLNISDTLGWIYIKKNLSDDAVRVFREIVNKDPNNATFHFHLAMALLQKGDLPNAKQECLTALKTSRTKDEQAKIKELMVKIG